MKRVKFIRHLQREGCLFFREGGKHTVYLNPDNKKTSTVPRHNEVNDFLAKKICKDLDVKKP